MKRKILLVLLIVQMSMLSLPAQAAERAGSNASAPQATARSARMDSTLFVFKRSVALSSLAPVLKAASARVLYLEHAGVSRGRFDVGSLPLDRALFSYMRTYKQLHDAEPSVFAIRVQGTLQSSLLGSLGHLVADLVHLPQDVPAPVVAPSADKPGALLKSPVLDAVDRTSSASSLDAGAKEHPWMPDYGTLVASSSQELELPQTISQTLRWDSQEDLDAFNANAYEHNLQLHNPLNQDLSPWYGSRPVCPPGNGGRFWATNDGAMLETSFPDEVGAYPDYTAGDNCSVMDFSVILFHPTVLSAGEIYSIDINAPAGEGEVRSSPFDLRSEMVSNDCFFGAFERPECFGLANLAIGAGTRERGGIIPLDAQCELPGQHVWNSSVEHAECPPVWTFQHTRASVPGSTENSWAMGASVSGLGESVAFYSPDPYDATDAGVGTNMDVIVYDRGTGVRQRISIGTFANVIGTPVEGHSFRPAISANGQHVAFISTARNLVFPPAKCCSENIFLHNRFTHTNQLVSVDSGGIQGASHQQTPSVSGDGRYVAFTSSSLDPSNGLGYQDVFVFDSTLGELTRVTSGNRESFDPEVSADGSHVVFASAATNLIPGGTANTQVFDWSVATGQTTLVSASPAGAAADGASWEPTVSANGRYVGLVTTSTDLLPPGQTFAENSWIGVRDMLTGITTPVSVAYNGAIRSGYAPSISRDGGAVAFSSGSSMVFGDFGTPDDVFVRNVAGQVTNKVSTSWSGGPANGWSQYASISLDGRTIAYHSFATNLVPEPDQNGNFDIFVATLNSI